MLMQQHYRRRIINIYLDIRQITGQKHGFFDAKAWLTSEKQACNAA